jgi:cytochrome b involved in lipid metabolism
MASVNDTADKKVLTWSDVKQLAEDKNKCIMVIDNRVYDVTRFIDEVCDYAIQ